MEESLDVAKFILNHKYRRVIPYFVFTDKRREELTFHIIDKKIKIIPQKGFIKGKVILPIIVNGFFPVKDFLSGEMICHPFDGFSSFTLNQIERMDENRLFEP